MTSVPVWSRWPQGALRVSSWYLSGAVLLTVLWLLARGLAPATGLTRSYYYPVGPATLPLIEEKVATIDLAFVDEQDRPDRNYLVRWSGVWFSPRPERFYLHAAADDGVLVVRLDGETVLSLRSRPSATRTGNTVELGAAGSHQLEIYHWQREGRQQMNLQWAQAGGTPAPLSPGRLFPENPGLLGYWTLAASTRLPILVLLVWVGGVSALLGRTIRRAVPRLTADAAWNRLRTVLFPALLGPSQILLFGPWTMHAANRPEFLAPFWSLAPRWLWLIGPLAAVLTAIAFLLPTQWFRRYVAILCAAGGLLWLQGNLLIADYGLLDGTDLDLASHAWRVPFEACLWIGVVGGAAFFANAVIRMAPTASALLVAAQTAALLLPTLAPAGPSTERRSPAAANWRLPPQEVYELSRSRNIIHIVLDMFPSQAFITIREADGSAFDRTWSGFTFFRNHLGAFPTTMASMPAMLTGVPFRNRTPLADYRRSHPSVFHALGQKGYRVRSLTGDARDHPGTAFPGADDAVRYTIPTPYGTYRDYVDSTSAQLLDLSLFRHAPHGLKAGVYREGDWLLQQQVALRRGRTATAWRALGDTAFLMELADRMEARGESPVYSFLHVITPHPPIVMTADCAYAGRLNLSGAGYMDQVRCALTAVQALLDRLHALVLYDRSAIVITSDHGTALAPPPDSPARRERSPSGESLRRMMADATPLLLIKPFGARGPLRISDAPTAITDLPATLLDLAGFPGTLGSGTSALELEPGSPRERTYANHSWGGRNNSRSRYFDVLHLFSVNGQVTSADAWRYRRAVFEPTDDPESQYRAHRIGMSAAQVDTAAPTGREVYRTGDYAAFFVKPGTDRIAFAVRRVKDSPERTVTVRVDGQVVDRFPLSDDGWRSVEHPVEARDVEDGPFCVELLVSAAGHDTGTEARGVLLRGNF